MATCSILTSPRSPALRTHRGRCNSVSRSSSDGIRPYEMMPATIQALCRTVCIFAVALSVFAQPPRGCDPPKELQAQRTSKPSSQADNILGAWFAQHGNSRCAISAFESALRADPNSREARYNLGLALLENKQPKRAATELEALVKQAPDYAPAHLGLSMALADLGVLQAAESEARAALKLDSTSSHA